MSTEPTKETIPANVAPPQKEKKLLDPENNIIRLSNSKDARFYIFLSKIILKKFSNLHLRAVGKATELCVQVSESLSRYPLKLTE